MKREAEALTDLILEVFRLNGRLLAAGESLARDLKLTSARWQVLGAIALSSAPLTVSQIARDMGLTRQAVQRLANEMSRDGLVRFAANPQHQRAKLVIATARGEAAYSAAMQRQLPWARALARGLGPRIEAATLTLNALRERLETDDTARED